MIEGKENILSLKNEAEIFRIGLIMGYFTKNDVIDWADKIIETQDEVEYEIIEVSLLVNSSKANIASKLKEVKGIIDGSLVINILLGLCSSSYNSKKFSIGEICGFLYSLVSNTTCIPIDSEIERIIHFLSDGYYLATEGIYGELTDVTRELKSFLDQYTAYSTEFSYW